MFNGKILSGDWDKGWLEITGMPKNFVLSARRLVVMEESEYAELVETRKMSESEPGEFTKDFRHTLGLGPKTRSRTARIIIMGLTACGHIDRLTALLREIVSANPECCWRKCWGCGKKQIHSSDVTPGVLCRFCGSQDTRLMKKETQALKGEKQCLD